MEPVDPSKNVVVYLDDWKRASEQINEQQPPAPPVADIRIRLAVNGDVTYERHNLTTYTARSLMFGCFVMLGEAMELVP